MCNPDDPTGMSRLRRPDDAEESDAVELQTLPLEL